MSAGAQAIAAKPRQAPMSGFERYLTLWVALCIVAGVALGQGLPDVFQAIGRMEVAQVNLPVGLLIWVMIVPMLVKIDFGALHQVKEHWRGIGVTLFVNWAVKPFSMALLGWLFIRQVFAPFLPADQLDSYIAGLILLAAAPCTAMVFVWSRLTNGDPLFTLSQVALNDAIMIVRRCFRTNKVVAGGGATEMELSKRLKESAVEVSGKEQLVMKLGRIQITYITVIQ